MDLGILVLSRTFLFHTYIDFIAVEIAIEIFFLYPRFTTKILINKLLVAPLLLKSLK